MDGISILIKTEPKDIIEDFCATLGGKSVNITNIKTIENSFTNIQWRVEIMPAFKNMFESRQRRQKVNDYETFDRILHDVPCTKDRQR